MAALLSDLSVLPHDILDDSGRYTDFRERFGNYLVDDQLMCQVLGDKLRSSCAIFE